MAPPGGLTPGDKIPRRFSSCKSINDRFVKSTRSCGSSTQFGRVGELRLNSVTSDWFSFQAKSPTHHCTQRLRLHCVLWAASLTQRKHDRGQNNKEPWRDMSGCRPEADSNGGIDSRLLGRPGCGLRDLLNRHRSAARGCKGTALSAGLCVDPPHIPGPNETADSRPVAKLPSAVPRI